MIKKVTIDAVSVRKANKDGVPYTYEEKDRATKKPTGKIKSRTLVSIKIGDKWYMNWSYKDGSAVETLSRGDVAELFLKDSEEDGGINNWRFVKEDDRKDAEIAELKAQLAQKQSESGVEQAAHAKPKVTKVKAEPTVVAPVEPAELADDGLEEIPF